MIEIVKQNLFHSFFPFSNAYRLACLGETSSTWEALGHACIEQGEYNLAKKCFSRIRDVKYLNLLANYEVKFYKIFKNKNKI